jgi:amino acid permease
MKQQQEAGVPAQGPSADAPGAGQEAGEAVDGAQGLRRAIGQRQLGMIAIGGAIGTGLFFASGSAISQAGPGGALVAYALMGFAVYCMMQSLGEMATQLPVAGSFEAYAERFVDPSLGFAFGWNYWFSWSITLAAEFVAGALIVQFWFPETNPTFWAMGFFALLMVLNLLSVKAYAEAEYWFSGVKVVTVLIFIVVGVLLITGLVGGKGTGLVNWSLTDPAHHLQAPFVGGGGAVLLVFLVAGFSFQGTEAVGLAAAESRDPARSVPAAIRSVFWRILLFYIGSIAVVGTLIPFTDPNLLRSDDGIAFSPFTIVFGQIPGVGVVAASVMNFVILSSVLSCGNSSLYVSSRMLYAMAHSGKAPALFGRLNRRGVPVAAVWATGLVGATAFLANAVGGQRIYQILYNASGLTGFLIWVGIAVCHLRFRRAWVAQGRPLSDLRFRSYLHPWGTWIALAIFLVVILGANADALRQPEMKWVDVLSGYAVLPAFLALYLGHKWAKGTRVVPLAQCRLDVDSPRS